MHSIHDSAALEEWRRRVRLDPGVLRRFRNQFYKRRRSPSAALAEIAEEFRQMLADGFEFHALALASRHDSQHDGASKLIFRTADGGLIESVILRLTTGRTTLCVSTQVGCAAQCEFCATGHMGLSRNLAPAEILDQLVQANQLLVIENRAVRNLVFMGMGEPFHNLAALEQAIAVLVDTRCFDLHARRLLVSTVGIPSAMIALADRYPQVRQAVSLHSVRQEVREQLMPIARRHPLDELRRAIVEVAQRGDHEVMIEYLLLSDINDSVDDAKELVAFVKGLRVHINLIPYNPIAAAPRLAASDGRRQQDFAAALKAAGLPVTTRFSLGRDIAAACGQLVQQRQHAHSAGRLATSMPAGA